MLSHQAKKDTFISDYTINAYQQLCDYLGFKNLGIISAKGFENSSEIENFQILIDAFKLGKSII